MFSAFDWQNALNERSDSINNRLKVALPVIAVSVNEGILMATLQKKAPKIFEIYDALVLGAIGQQADVDALRSAAVDFAHQEGFNRSEEDVSIQRVVNALSAPLKRAFGDLNSVPFTAKLLFAQVGSTPADDVTYVLRADGDFEVGKTPMAICGSDEEARFLLEKLEGPADLQSRMPKIRSLLEEWQDSKQESASERMDIFFRATLLRRADGRESRFEAVE